MPKQKRQEDEPQAVQPPQAPPDLSAAVGNYVLLALGRPTNLYAVRAHRLWAGHYRVNVLVGSDAATVRVAHSYFLVTDGEGNLCSSSPEITEEYARGADGRTAALA